MELLVMGSLSGLGAESADSKNNKVNKNTSLYFFLK